MNNLDEWRNPNQIDDWTYADVKKIFHIKGFLLRWHTQAYTVGKVAVLELKNDFFAASLIYYIKSQDFLDI